MTTKNTSLSTINFHFYYFLPRWKRGNSNESTTTKKQKWFYLFIQHLMISRSEDVTMSNQKFYRIQDFVRLLMYVDDG